MVEEFRSAIVNLVKDHPQVEILTLKSLGKCQRVFLKENNTDGFVWSFKVLQGVTRTWFSESPDHERFDKLFSILVTNFQSSDEDVEDSGVLAALIVGSQALRCGRYELAVKWLENRHAVARTMILKHELVFHLATAFARRNLLEEALHWFAVAKEHTDSTTESRVTFMMGFFSAVLGRFDSVRNFEAQLTDDGDPASFSSALAAMLGAECKYFESPSRGVSRRQLISGYSQARRLLFSSCMPSLEMKLAKFIGGSNVCPQGFFFKILSLELDGFAQLLDSHMIKFEEAEPRAPLPVSHCFFAHELYRTSRKRMIQLQTAGTVECFMDPRPHIEEAYDNFQDKIIDLPSILLAHQISLKAGHFTCFLLASELLALLRDGNIKADQLFAILCSAFGDNCADQEDPEAWAAYHMGSLSWMPGLVRQPDPRSNISAYARYSFLEKSLSQARTPTLKSLAAVSLHIQANEFSEKLDLLEISTNKAIEAGHEDLIVQASCLLSGGLQISGRYGKMFNLIEQLNKVATEKFSSSSCLLALIKLMEGVLNVSVEQVGPNYSSGYEQLEQGLALIPGDTKTEVLYWRYFSNEDDNWSTIRNHYMNHMKNVTLNLLSHRSYLNQDRNNISSSLDRDAEVLLQHLNWLIYTYNLEEAEAVGAELLGRLGDGEQLFAYVLLLLVWLSGRYFQRDYRGGQRPNAGTSTSNDVERCLSQIMDSFVEASLAIAQDLNAPHMISEAYWYHSIGFDLLGEGLKSLQKMQESLRALMQEDVNFGTFSSGRINHMDKFLPRFQVLQLAFIQLGDIGRALVWSERHRTRDFMFKLRNANMEMYLKDLAAFDSDDSKAFEEIVDTLNILGQHTVVIAINQYREEQSSDWVFIVYFLHLSKAMVHRQELTAQDLVFVTEELQQLVQTTDDYFSDVTFRSYFETLHDTLVEPFTAELQEVQARKIIFVPSKEMSTVPFSLLLDKSRDEFLIQQYAVSVTSSLRLLKRCELRRLELMANVAQCSTLVVGNPTNDLRNASEEAHTIAGLLRSKPGCSITELHHDRATKQAVLEEFPQSDWIHVASHCIVNEEFPDGALLLASGMNRGPGSTSSGTRVDIEENIARRLRDANENEKLFGDEIMEHCSTNKMRASGAVLSACASGVGRKYAEGILALPRSFHVCGVPSVVVSLWPVEDESTSKLMSIMYENLLVGKELSEALQEAMVHMLLEVDMLGNPVHTVRQWAPFVISGSCSTKHPFFMVSSC